MTCQAGTGDTGQKLQQNVYLAFTCNQRTRLYVTFSSLKRTVYHPIEKI